VCSHRHDRRHVSAFVPAARGYVAGRMRGLNTTSDARRQSLERALSSHAEEPLFVPTWTEARTHRGVPKQARSSLNQIVRPSRPLDSPQVISRPVSSNSMYWSALGCAIQPPVKVCFGVFTVKPTLRTRHG
jgi:hypothetical protein